MSSLPSAIHPSALVADSAEIGPGVRIGPGCIIGPYVRLGSGCILHERVIIQGKTELGDECEVFPYAALGKRPQDKKIRGNREELLRDGFIDEEDHWTGKLIIGRDAEIREYVSIHGGTPWGRGETRVGSDVMFLAGSHVGHDCLVGDHVVFTNGAMVAGHSQVMDHAVLGAMSGLHQRARVGRFAMLGAGSMASQDVPPFSMVQGDRARLVAVNLVGLRRAGFDNPQAMTVKKVYRLLFWRSGSMKERLANAEAFALGDPLAEEIFQFLRESERGVCVPRDRREDASPDHHAH
ncbi:MAG: acyl-ACP--UDP-N-acetylglucosamine O-acyltransferase [Planctomycetota bacterium]